MKFYERRISGFELKRRWFCVFIGILGILIPGSGIFHASSGRTETAGMISDTIRSVLERDLSLSECLKPESVKVLIRYYESRWWTPYWVDRNGPSSLVTDWIQTSRP